MKRPLVIATAVCLLLVLNHAQAAPRIQVLGLTDTALITNVGLSVPQIAFGCDASNAQARRYLRSAKESANNALQALGHFNATIEKRVEHRRDCIVPILEIDAGPPTYLTEVTLDIPQNLRDFRSIAEFIADNTPEIDAPLVQREYDRLRDGIRDRAHRLGYLDARFSQRQLRVDPETQTAKIILVMDSGERYHFGDIAIHQDILNPELVSQMAGVFPGDDYTSNRLLQINRNLGSTDYFRAVTVRPVLEQRADLQVPVDVQTTINPRTTYEFRAGYGTDTGPRVGARMIRRYINKRGHNIDARTSISQIAQRVEAAYSIPRRSDPLAQQYDIYARANREDNNNIETLSSTIGAQWAVDRERWSTSIFTEYLLERSKYGRQPASTSNFLLLGARAGIKELDDPLFPTEGIVISTSLQGASEELGSSTSLLRGTAFAGMYIPLGDFIFKLRGEGGAVISDGFDQVPKSLRFFTGGDNSVRGYDFESLAPKDADGQLVGGQYQLVGSFEAMYPVVGDDWYLAGFIDTGNAFNDLDDMDLHTGTGMGVRWRSPIGQVRADIGVPLTGETNNITFHIGIGADF